MNVYIKWKMMIEGNQFWKLRSKHGRDKLFATHELMWNAACEYFEWCDKNPWVTKKTKIRNGQEATSEEDSTPIQRPYTMSGLCLYLDCSQSYFRQFKTNCNDDFLTIITRIEEVVETQQFEGATVGAFNANIIARKLGLSDKQESTSTLNIRTAPLSKEELSKRLSELENEI